MKVIDLLNKIANGENIPRSIEYMGEQYDYDEETKDYTYADEDNIDIWLFDKYNASSILNDEIEIIEEDKAIEELKIPEIDDVKNERIVRAEFKINELVKAVNDISSKERNERNDS
jgi:sortase (surface protein transpeptidase)